MSAAVPVLPPVESLCTRCDLDPCECGSYVGGSDAANLLSVPHFGKGCKRQLGYLKSGAPQDFPEETRNREIALAGVFRRGNLLENVAAQMYMDATGFQLIRRRALRWHPNYPGAAVHTDRIQISTTSTPTADIEIKTAAEGPFLGMLRRGLPAAYSLQLQWSLFVTGHQLGVAIVLGLCSDLPLKFFNIQRDEETIAIFERETQSFWATLGKGELPPPLPDPNDQRCKVCSWRRTCRGVEQDAEEMESLLLEAAGKKKLTAIESPELAQACYDRAVIMSEIEALDCDQQTETKELGAKQLINARILELLGDTEAALVNKQWRVFQRPSTWSGVDLQRLKLEDPEIYKKYQVTRATGKQRLTINPVKGEQR